MGNIAYEKLNIVTAEISGRRYCAHHRGKVLVDDGSFVTRNKSRRWICHRCQMKSLARDEEIKIEKIRAYKLYTESSNILNLGGSTRKK